MLCSFSSLVIRNRHRVAMYFHAPCGVVLYCFVCKLYANKEKKKKKKKIYEYTLYNGRNYPLPDRCGRALIVQHWEASIFNF